MSCQTSAKHSPVALKDSPASMKQVQINRWAYIAVVISVTVGLGLLLGFASSYTKQLDPRDLHRYGLLALLLLLPMLTFPLGIIGFLFTLPFISSGIFEMSEAFVVASPVFAATGWFQWYFLYPKLFGRQPLPASNEDTSHPSPALLAPNRRTALVAHLCIPILVTLVTSAVGIIREPFAIDVFLTFLMGGFLFYTGPHLLWGIVASVGAFSKVVWHAGFIASTVALLATSAFWLGPRDTSGLPMQWILYWPLALTLMLVLPAIVSLISRKKLAKP